MDSEHYVSSWHRLFPVYLVSGLLLVLVGSILPSAIVELAFLSNSGLVTIIENYSAGISFIIYPVAPFALFFLVTRFRVDLGRDYLPVLLSIFIGAAVGIIPSTVLMNSLGTTLSPSQSLLIVLGNVLSSGLETAFVGFAAVLLSYRRRI